MLRTYIAVVLYVHELVSLAAVESKVCVEPRHNCTNHTCDYFNIVISTLPPVMQITCAAPYQVMTRPSCYHSCSVDTQE